MPAGVYLLLVLALGLGTRGFNLEPRHSIVINHPTSDLDSYFGYSLKFWQSTSHGQTKTWLLVGAPNASVPKLTGKLVERPGAMYKCEVEQHNATSCIMVEVIGPEEKKKQDVPKWTEQINILAGAWIGGTIAVENRLNGDVAVCGSRMLRWVLWNQTFIPGTCYWKEDEHVVVVPSVGSINKNKWSGLETGVAQVGMSAELLQNTTRPQLLLGAPGLYNFRGRMVLYEKNSKGLPTVHIVHNDTDVRSNSYLGYSLTSARFQSDGSISYISGAPRALGRERLTGAVYVVHKHAKTPQKDSYATLQGYQMGEYFGATVAVLDLNMDGVDDLLVIGAPQHSLSNSNEEASAGDHGMVYVYHNKEGNLTELLGQRLTGSSAPEARFGSSLAVVGDINKDGFSDLVVGAPYERRHDDERSGTRGGSGAIYLYSGQAQGLRTTYSQRIVASDVDSHLNGFGISIAGGMDIDGNHINDIAVGSYESSKAVIIKSYPVIDFKATLQPSVKILDLNATQFAIKACLQYNSRGGTNVSQDIVAEMTLKVDTALKRAAFQSALNSPTKQLRTNQVVFYHGDPFCWSLNVTIKENHDQIIEPIKLTLEYKLLDDPSKKTDGEFCKICPMTDPLKPSVIHTQVPFAHGCNNETGCKADLKVEVNSSTNGEALVLGKTAELTLLVTVNNSADPAFLSTLSATLPGKDMLLKVPKQCHKDENADSKSRQERFLCKLGSLISKEVLVPFEVNLGKLDVYTTHLDFNFTAWSNTSDELNPQDNSYSVSIPIALESQLVINGKTTRSNVILSSNDSLKNTDISVFHKYEVVNYGPSPVREVRIEFQVPVALIKSTDSKGKVFVSFLNPQVTVDGQTFQCEVDRGVLNDSRIDSQVSARWLENPMELEALPHPAPTAEGDLERKRRSLEDWVANVTGLEEQEVRVRRVLYLNCSGKGLEAEQEVVCVSVTCMAGPISARIMAEVTLNLHFHKTVLDSLIEPTDAAQFETFGAVHIVDKQRYTVQSDPSKEVASVKTVFMVESKGEEMATWIILLAIVLGLLLLQLLVMILSNIGFFKRGHKEKLQMRKEEIAAEEEFEFIDPNILQSTADLLSDEEY